MATIQVENIVAIVVDRGMRDVLRNCLRSEACQLENCEGVIHGSDSEAAHEALARAVDVVDMFDQLGWQDDDPRERYEITVALDSFVPWLRGCRGDLAVSLADEMKCLRLIAARAEPHSSAGRTQQEMMAMTDDDVLGWSRELEAVETLLERLESAAGVGGCR
jgi:hypothetical protein